MFRQCRYCGLQALLRGHGTHEAFCLHRHTPVEGAHCRWCSVPARAAALALVVAGRSLAVAEKASGYAKSTISEMYATALENGCVQPKQPTTHPQRQCHCRAMFTPAVNHPKQEWCSTKCRRVYGMTPSLIR